jgi:ribosomal protein S18 acetylase RimI-like enzyme
MAQFDAELTGLTDKYRWILLATLGEDDDPIGCIAVRLLEPGIAEIKRLFVKPSARGLGAARALVLKAMETARMSGIERVRLDTLPDMIAAQQLYLSVGFRVIDRYYPSAPPTALFYERDLGI